ncbi:hypothetical protein [Bacillus sp. ISL-55]|uniref:hypothetical protein n=1 Tax=Bacillus sp. ISL-55 TaxID=2819134 RepID=UPI001BEC356B|nr:hypothetical protein [Bacillus sp. ISL-55]MBT2693153.1 hypothetical protein [Bacillus sp. ISL-55]
MDNKQLGTRVSGQAARSLEELASEQGNSISTEIKNAVEFYLLERKLKKLKNMTRIGIELNRLSNDSLDRVFNLFNDLTLSDEMDQTDFVSFFGQLLEEKVNRAKEQTTNE